MDNLFWILLVLAVAMAGVSWHAHRLGNERRDVVMLGVVAALLGTGSAIAAAL